MAPTASSYDLFLSYNSADHRIVEEVAHKLANAGLKELFLDRWNLPLGTRWRPVLEKALGSSKAVAIFVGPGEMGSWQQREVDIALDLQSKSSTFPVIPVLLRDCEPPLGFLGQLTWVDFRTQTLDLGIAILAKAARGEAPGPDLQKHLDAVRASICPYRGLLHFREEDAPFFFGREAVIDQLTDKVRRQPFVAVVGASGSGKSSVVRAGLLPRLRSDGNAAWETVILVPTDQPLKALARAFLPLLEPSMGEVDRLAEVTKLAEHFRLGRISLYDIIERIFEKQSGTNRVLIIVDQFEELYTLTSDEEARRRFLHELLTTTSHAGSKANVLLGMRGDFVGKALAYRPLSDRLQDAQINLGPMTREELECAIRKPADKIQLEFEASLVRRILDDVGDEPGNLPLLEFVLKELWDKRHGGVLLNETYDAIGGVQGAVATKADELLKGLSSAEQKILQRIFLRIVRPSENGLDTRRRAAFSELPPEGAELVVKLAKERLLVTNRSESDREQTVEVAHEALISNWSTLRAWVNEDREFLLWRERLSALLAEWERAQESGEALLRGPLLMEAQKWFDQRSQDLSDQERKFISESRALRERLAREERERQEREIEAARRLAEEQKRRAELSEEREKEQKEAARKLRRRAIAAAGAAAVAVILLATSVFMWLAAQDQAASARVANERTGEVASHANVSLARYSHEAGNDAKAFAHLAEALRLNQRSYEAAGLTGRMLTQTSWPLPVSGPMRHNSSFYSAQFSPDGQWVLTASDDKTARLWDAQSGKPLGEPMRHETEVISAQFSPDGRRVVTASKNGTVQLWDALSGKPLGEPMRHGAEVFSAQFSPDGQQVVTVSQDATARLWDALSGKPLGEPMRHGAEVFSAQFSPDGQRVVTASQDATARLWDALSGKPIGEPMRHGAGVFSAQFSPDGQRVVTASFDKTARLWDALSGKPLGEPMQHEGSVNSAQFSPDGQRVVTASSSLPLWAQGRDATARLWDAATGKAIGEPMKFSSAQFSPDSQRLVTASDDKTARLWDARTGKPLGEPMQHGAAVSSARFSPDGQRVVTASFDKTARLWDALSGKPLSEPMQHEGPVNSAQFSPDGQRVATASYDNTARLWDARTGKPLGEPMRHETAVSSAQFSPDGRRVLTAGLNLNVQLWDALSGKPLSEPMKHDDTVNSAQFSPDGQRVVTASYDNTARLWDALSGKPLGEPMQHGAGVNSAQFSPDGQRVVTASEDNTARLWDARTGKPLGEPMQHRSVGVLGAGVNSAQFSPDGQRLVTASQDAMARLWDARTGKPIGEPMQHGARVSSAQFSPNGQRVVTASDDNTARLWDAATGKPLGEPMRHGAGVNSAQFSPDGQRVVTASFDNTARLWDALSGKPLGEPMQHGVGVHSAQFSPDGQRVVTASQDATARLWDALSGKPLGEPMQHARGVNSSAQGSGSVNSAQFSPDGQRVVTASVDKTARLWDAPTISRKDTAEDVRLLADLAEAAGGVALQTSGQAEILNFLTPEQTRATREKIAAVFPTPSSKLTPLQRFLKWDVSEPRSRTISPFSELTVAEWVENKIKEGTPDDMRTAIQVNPTDARLAAHFGLALANLAVAEKTDPDNARVARAEADFQTRRALDLAPDNDEVKKLRAEVVKLLQLNLE